MSDYYGSTNASDSDLKDSNLGAEWDLNTDVVKLEDPDTGNGKVLTRTGLVDPDFFVGHQPK